MASSSPQKRLVQFDEDASPGIENESELSNRQSRRLVWSIMTPKTSEFHMHQVEAQPNWADVARRWFGKGIMFLIVANVMIIAVALEVWGDNKAFTDFVWYFEIVSLVVFSVEYFVRLWACVEDPRYSHPIKGRLRWMVKPLSLIDFLALIPFYVDISIEDNQFRGATSLRLLRLFSLLRMERQSKSFKRLGRVLNSKKEELIVTLFVATVMLILSSTTMYFIENPVQPDKYSSVLETMWWAVTALTTVGYGDIYPITSFGKVIACLVAFLGIGLFALPAGIMGSGFIEEMYEEQRKAEAERKEQKRKQKAEEKELRMRNYRASLASHGETLRPTVECPHCEHVFELRLQIEAMVNSKKATSDDGLE